MKKSFSKIIEKLSNKKTRRQDADKAPQVSGGYCFTTHTCTVTKDDNEEKWSEDWEKYLADKKDPECKFSSFIDLKKTHKVYYWDGKKQDETIRDLNNYGEIEVNLRAALMYMNSEAAEKDGCKIKHGYDYAWLYKIICDVSYLRKGQLNYHSTREFVEDIEHHLEELGLKVNICKEETINKYLKKVHGEELPLKFMGCGILEAKRRNKIAESFLRHLNQV